MQKKIIIYQSHLNEVGGCETFTYNLTKQLKDWYDILVIYDSADLKQLSRINEYVKTELYDKNKEYKADILIQNSMWGKINDKIKADRVIGMVHTDYQKIESPIDIQFDKIDEFVGCGENAAKKFSEKYGVKCTPIKNILDIKHPIKYNFISAGRLDENKGWDRMKVMINMLRNADIDFSWIIFTNNEKKCEYEEVKFMKPQYDIWNYLREADYGVLLSKAEGYPYFVSECLQYDTPVIGTDVSGINEIIENGKNGYLVPLSMEFDINIIKNIPIVRNYSNGTTVDTWKNYLGGSEYKKKEKKKMKYLVKFNTGYGHTFFDDTKVLDEKGIMIRRDKNSDAWLVDEERKNYLLAHGAIIVIEAIEEEVKSELDNINTENTNKEKTTKKKVNKKK